MEEIIMNNNPNMSPAGPVLGKGFAIASMVLGIIALVRPFSLLSFGVLFFLDVAISIVGLVLGLSGKKKLLSFGAPTGMATAGIVMCIISLALTVVVTIACASCMAALGAL